MSPRAATIDKGSAAAKAAVALGAKIRAAVKTWEQADATVTDRRNQLALAELDREEALVELSGLVGMDQARALTGTAVTRKRRNTNGNGKGTS